MIPSRGASASRARHRNRLRVSGNARNRDENLSPHFTDCSCPRSFSLRSDDAPTDLPAPSETTSLLGLLLSAPTHLTANQTRSLRTARHVVPAFLHARSRIGSRSAPPPLARHAPPQRTGQTFANSNQGARPRLRITFGRRSWPAPVSDYHMRSILLRNKLRPRMLA